MRLKIRKDLGGYAVGLDGLSVLEGVEFTRPFVLLCGPTGSGKSTVLKMMMATLGLVGFRHGFAGTVGKSPLDPDECSEDPGRLAAFRDSVLRSGVPGVFDFEAMGWKGHRARLFDGRAEVGFATETDSYRDGYHSPPLGPWDKEILDKTKVREQWQETVQWALGAIDVDDPYDVPAKLHPHRSKLLEIALAGAPRPRERWLLLDDPETAMDTERLAVGLFTLVRKARIGRLRVVCASHSPLFAAGLSKDENVQVVDFGGEKSWIDTQRRALSVAMSPAAVVKIADKAEKKVLIDVKKQKLAFERKMAKTFRGISDKGVAAMLASVDGRIPFPEPGSEKLHWSTYESLTRRGFIDPFTWGLLTESGLAAIAWLRAKKANDARSRHNDSLT